MSGLLRLYPRAWRERYGDELAALLEEHPASLVDQLDLIRGAFDARLHPQVPGAPAPPDKEVPVNQKVLGVLAAVGGIAWIVGIASVLVLPRDVYGERDASVGAILLALASGLIGVALGELGTREGSASSRRTGHAVSVLGLAFGATLVLGWPLFIIGLIGFPVLAGLSAARGASNAVFPGWLAVVIGIAAVAALGGYFGQGIESDSSVVMIAMLGAAALVLALLALRGRSTTVAGPTQKLA